MSSDIEPTITLEETMSRVEERKFPRVTQDSIKEKIADVTYHRQGTLTICVITMRNGFMQVGKAAPADTRNFDPEVGERYAFEDAFRGLWHLEGYLLCERLAGY